MFALIFIIFFCGTAQTMQKYTAPHQIRPVTNRKNCFKDVRFLYKNDDNNESTTKTFEYLQPMLTSHKLENGDHMADLFLTLHYNALSFLDDLKKGILQEFHNKPIGQSNLPYYQILYWLLRFENLKTLTLKKATSMLEKNFTEKAVTSIDVALALGSFVITVILINTLTKEYTRYHVNNENHSSVATFMSMILLILMPLSINLLIHLICEKGIILDCYEIRKYPIEFIKNRATLKKEAPTLIDKLFDPYIKELKKLLTQSLKIQTLRSQSFITTTQN